MCPSHRESHDVLPTGNDEFPQRFATQLFCMANMGFYGGIAKVHGVGSFPVTSPFVRVRCYHIAYVALQQAINSHLTAEKNSSMPYRLPPLNALRAFEAAARHLSFKKAADELAVTPTAVSHQIKLLERFLDLALFRRLTRALELTPQGEAMLPKVREGLECFAAAVERTREHATPGRLIVVAPPSFAARWLVPRLKQFTRAQPLVRLHVVSSVSAIENNPLAETTMPDSIDLREDDSQVMIHYGTGTYPGARIDRIFGPDYIAVCSPKLLEAKRPLRQVSDVKYHLLLHDDTIANELARPSWEEWLRVAGVTGVDPNIGPHFRNSGLALVAAVDGLGIALASKPLVADEIAAGRLVAPFDIAIGQQYAYFLVTPAAISDRPVVQAFRQWLLLMRDNDHPIRQVHRGVKAI
ncbi:MAG: transcriptional regulator GcvA [Proteobacteria bacterium]|nr:transcriptional regulator GcvA [Pseudomonadota bacterium]